MDDERLQHKKLRTYVPSGLKRARENCLWSSFGPVRDAIKSFFDNGVCLCVCLTNTTHQKKIKKIKMGSSTCLSWTPGLESGGMYQLNPAGVLLPLLSECFSPLFLLSTSLTGWSAGLKTKYKNINNKAWKIILVKQCLFWIQRCTFYMYSNTELHPCTTWCTSNWYNGRCGYAQLWAGLCAHALDPQHVAIYETLHPT